MFFWRKSKRSMEFGKILEIATSIYQKNPKELHNLIRLLGRKAQSNHLTYILKHENDREMVMASPTTMWFNPYEKLGNDEKSLYDLRIELNQDYEVSLSNDVVLTNPWAGGRMRTALIQHGQGRERGIWKQDSYNHVAQLWLPMNVTWVSNGNHSIAAGIIQRDGVLIPKEVYDISPIFEYVRCDGDNFIDIQRNVKISKVRDVEFSAIFEIGRLMIS